MQDRFFRSGDSRWRARQRMYKDNSVKIIGISGSLRTVSLSTALLNAAATQAPRYVKLVVYDGIGNLPHFNPELDKEPVPPAVLEFRSQLNSSAGVVIAT